MRERRYAGRLNGNRKTGIDFSEAMIAKARRAHPHITFTMEPSRPKTLRSANRLTWCLYLQQHRSF